MASILETLNVLQSGDVPRALSRQLGVDEAGTQSAVSAALPVLLGALARNASRPEGARELSAALAKDHDGGLLDDLGGFLGGSLGGSRSADGDGILRHVLGARRGAVEAELGRRSGLDAASVARILSTLAPVVMGALGRTQREQRLDESGLAQMLGGERERAERAAPAGYGMLTQLLDSDRDGQIGDDVARLGGGLLRRLFRGRR